MARLVFPSGREVEVKHGMAQKTYRAAPAGAVSSPGILRLGWRYINAVRHWKAAGSPLRSQAEIDAALAICNKCEFFSKSTKQKKPFCSQCGCQLNNLRNGLVNKIAMATEHCPLTPPKW